jgi:hypothetical protein
MSYSLKVFPNGISDQELQNQIIINQQNNLIQTYPNNGKVIHQLKNSKVAEYFLRFLSCPFLNATVFSGLFNKQKLNHTLLAPTLNERAECASILMPYFYKVLTQESTKKAARFHTDNLIKAWAEKKPITVNLQSEIGLLFNRWCLNGFLKPFDDAEPHHDLENLSQYAQFFFESIPDNFSNELLKTCHWLKMKGLFSNTINHQSKLKKSFVNKLIEHNWDLEVIKSNFQSILCIVNQTSSLLGSYLLWFISINKERREKYHSIALKAEEIFAASEDWESYFQELKPIEELIENWPKDFSPSEWESKMPFDALFSNEGSSYYFTKGDAVKVNELSMEKSEELEFDSTFFINENDHLCHQDKDFNRILCITLSMILSRVEFIPQEPSPQFEICVFPKSKSPIIFNWINKIDQSS